MPPPIELRNWLEREWLLALGGLVSVAFGILLLVFPGSGALGLPWLIGAYAVLFGVILIALGFRLRCRPRTAATGSAGATSCTPMGALDQLLRSLDGHRARVVGRDPFPREHGWPATPPIGSEPTGCGVGGWGIIERNEVRTLGCGQVPLSDEGEWLSPVLTGPVATPRLGFDSKRHAKLPRSGLRAGLFVSSRVAPELSSVDRGEGRVGAAGELRLRAV